MNKKINNNMSGKKILVVGLGVSGLASIKALDKMGAEIYAYDGKTQNDLSEKLEEIKNIKVKYYFNSLDFDENIELCIKSPGINMHTEVMEKILSMNIPVVSDLEAAYDIAKSKFIAITGTNGKTTTTTLIGEILKEAKVKNYVTGNIGYGVFYDASRSNSDEYLVTECSSFQLDGTEEFEPYISVMTNLTPDHLDWHGSVPNYYDAKFKACVNQDENDYCILNYEDEEIRKRAERVNANIIYFSSSRNLSNLKNSIYVDRINDTPNGNEDGSIVLKLDNKFEKIMKVDDIFIPGKHNLENCLCAIVVCKLLNVATEDIEKTIKKFKGVEHRLEFVTEINSVKYYNDSKGTNPDASIKAIRGMKAPVILIAGGYDKKSDYSEFIKSFDGKVKNMILLGDTKFDILNKAKEFGFNDNIIVDNMEEAVKTAVSIAEPGDTVLLSPACASWDMYKNYEIRGKDFKKKVMAYGSERGKN